MKRRVIELPGANVELPLADNTSEALKIFRGTNERFRELPWPRPFDRTTHLIERARRAT